MTTVKLSSGKEIPIMGLGTINQPDKIGEVIKDAIEIGYRHFDCAGGYLNEKAIGDALQELIKNGKIKREEIWITSKLWNIYHDPKDVIEICKKSIKDLQCEYLDLYLMHWPLAWFKNEKEDLAPMEEDNKTIKTVDIPLIETWKAMESLVDQGLVKSIGVSNFTEKHIEEIFGQAKIKPAMNQIENHPYLAQNELVSYCKSKGINITAYSPLGTAHLKRPEDPVLLKDPVILQMAQDLNVSPAQIVLKWNMIRGVIVIPRSSSKNHLLDNFNALNLKLSDEQFKAISDLDKHFRFIRPLDLWGIDVFDEKK
eukprot:Anaeramoba_ignava/a479503_117.p1 GENE.a479503_117~~a479503_117.p1  ORF type:complete len:312 (+),score=111.73 a479503_117:100-1035(+)